MSKGSIPLPPPLSFLAYKNFKLVYFHVFTRVARFFSISFLEQPFLFFFVTIFIAIFIRFTFVSQLQLHIARCEAAHTQGLHLHAARHWPCHQ